MVLEVVKKGVKRTDYGSCAKVIIKGACCSAGPMPMK